MQPVWGKVFGWFVKCEPLPCHWIEIPATSVVVIVGTVVSCFDHYVQEREGETEERYQRLRSGLERLTSVCSPGPGRHQNLSVVVGTVRN